MATNQVKTNKVANKKNKIEIDRTDKHKEKGVEKTRHKKIELKSLQAVVYFRFVLLEREHFLETCFLFCC